MLAHDGFDARAAERDALLNAVTAADSALGLNDDWVKAKDIQRVLDTWVRTSYGAERAPRGLGAAWRRGDLERAWRAD